MGHHNSTPQDADLICFQLQCGINALGAIHSAMESGGMEPGSFIDGLFGVYDYLNTSLQELNHALGIPETGRIK